MAYKLRIAKGAFDRLRLAARREPIPSQVLDYLFDELRILADDPTEISRPAVFPFVPRGQAHDFLVEHGDYRYRFHVSFYYSQDETSILVFDIGLIRYLIEN